MLMINILWKNCSFKNKNSDLTSKKLYPHLLFLAHFILNSIIMQQRDALFWELRRKFTLALIIMTSLSSPKKSHNVARILLKLKLHFNFFLHNSTRYFQTSSRVFLQCQLLNTSKSSSTNLSNQNKHLWWYYKNSSFWHFNSRFDYWDFFDKLLEVIIDDP